jgi:hypothetical protein
MQAVNSRKDIVDTRNVAWQLDGGGLLGVGDDKQK